MESLDWFRKLFDYSGWGNQEAFQSIETVSGSQERALKVAGHIIGAQQVWLARLEGADPSTLTPWPDLNIEEMRIAAEDLHGRFTAFLDTLTPQKLEQDLVYRNTKGVEFRTPLRDVLMHLVMHSTYHRGQIAAAVREAGGKPAATDYVVYVRQLQKS